MRSTAGSHPNWRNGDGIRPERGRPVANPARTALATALGNLAGGRPDGTDDLVAGYDAPARRDPWTLIVGHDGVFKVTLLTLFDLPLERFWMWSFELCAITIVDIREGRPILRAHNLSSHLAPRIDVAALAEQTAREASGAL
jgi:broad specificity phosphatase PhoE